MIRIVKTKLVLLLLLFPINKFLYAQDHLNSEEEIDEIIDHIIAIDDEDLIDILGELNKYQILFTSVNFNDKTYFLGRDIGVDQFNIATQLMYENSNGIFAGISGAYYGEFDPNWDLTIVSAGYGKSFGKNNNIRTELGYSRYIFSDPSTNDFDNSIDASINISTNNDVFGVSINTSYLFGGKTGWQSSASVYGDVKLLDLNSKKGSKITFGPDLSFILGSENIDTSRIDNLGIDIPFINRIVTEFETFSLRNIQLELPITFEFNSLHIEAGYNINFPEAFSFENDLDNTSFFNLGLSYIFDLWQDSNLRPPRPKRGAITGLRYTPNMVILLRTANIDVSFNNLSYFICKFYSILNRSRFKNSMGSRISSRW